MPCDNIRTGSSQRVANSRCAGGALAENDWITMMTAHENNAYTSSAASHQTEEEETLP